MGRIPISLDQKGFVSKSKYSEAYYFYQLDRWYPSCIKSGRLMTFEQFKAEFPFSSNYTRKRYKNKQK